jgi:hypothetical protein
LIQLYVKKKKLFKRRGELGVSQSVLHHIRSALPSRDSIRLDNKTLQAYEKTNES